MNKTLCFICLCLGLLLSTPMQAKVKFIDLSWANPTIDFLEKNLAAMEAKAPLDGLVIRVYGKQATRNGITKTPGKGNFWNKWPMEYEDFTDAIARLKALPFKKFTDNFFYVTTSDVDLDWFSDSDWDAIAANMGIIARVSKEAGLKGMLVDIEQYGKHFWDTDDFETTRNDTEFAEAAYRRGQQWGNAVFGAYPDIILFMPFCLSMASEGGLSIPFINGVIDVMPPTAKIYDGIETDSYSAKRPDSYLLLQSLLQKLIRKNVRPELQLKARSQILLTPAFYLDAIFAHSTTSPWYKRLCPEIEQKSKLDFFRCNLIGAAQEADPYIWLYGEVRAWWDGWSHSRKQGHWEDAEGAKGITDVVRMVSNLDDFKVVEANNMVRDGKFEHGPNSAWGGWQFEEDVKKPVPGGFKIEVGRGVCFKMNRGCLNQTLPIKGGHAYYFECSGGYTAGKDTGRAGGCLAFKENKIWLPSSGNVGLGFPHTGKEETVKTIVIAPENATHVSVQFYANRQKGVGEAYCTHVFLQELK